MKYFTFTRLNPHALVISAALVLSACGSDNNKSAAEVVATPVDAEDQQLTFDASDYTSLTVNIDGTDKAIRQYRIVYVANPIEMATTQSRFGQTITLEDPYVYQTMIISVPEASVEDQSTAIYFAVDNSGWFNSPVSTTITDGAEFVSTSDTDNIGAALKAGYVVANVGTRSRGIRAADGHWAGKAPAPVVDSKAAIRYLRLNDAVMPGSAERIVVNGTSGGGGLTSAVSASGNSADYLPYLNAIGAAGITGSGDKLSSTLNDDVFAAIAYCPINNLGNADIGYEWQYNAVRSDSNTGAINGVAYSAGVQPAASAEMASMFPTYLNNLNLKKDDGTAITDQNLNDLLVGELKAELERQIAAGVTVPNLGETFNVTQRGTTYSLTNNWLTLRGTGTTATVSNIDVEKFLAFVASSINLKTVVAFDATAETGNPSVSGETNLFGSDYYEYGNFNAWTWTNNEVLGDGSGVDDTGLSWADYLADTDSNNLAAQINLINPINYLETADADVAPHWYVRHGMVDRDTAFAMQLTLYYALKNNAKVEDVSFKIPYLVPHSGNYDVQEAFAWLKTTLANNPL
ncbi:hypothetical protein KDN34_06120 [Shewanella yunxiaonensis]|uniref:BD-FAE-like domain-containing protein n=1 Tax=Shewanella yunxiaonensis TaxID=2829809 RepID=A0ABX7YXJ9_9GAMM|nr:subtype B tannase [Shewanella yunxiaonensis]QUN07009.1 hypothetical protein KDN34_06120 [Shewanella yunxiaonensis]